MEDIVVLVKQDLFILNHIILEEVNQSIILELIHVNRYDLFWIMHQTK